MSKFTWGKVIDRFEYDFDGDKVEIVKYFPKKANYLNGGFEDVPQYHIEELHESAYSLQYILIAWVAYKNLGLNQHALVAGVCRALDVKS